ncbi:MAG: hypothetical protein ACO39C_10040, partial [Chthoniobacterales bacterium]
TKKENGMTELPLTENGRAGEPVLSVPRSSTSDHDVKWYERMVRQSVALGVQTEIHRLTPTLAEYLLDATNDGNRHVRPNSVSAYAKDIAAGRWRFNGEALKVSREGKLNDGQHRCHAVIEAGQSIEVLWIFGLPRDTRETLDQGATRTAGDYLKMTGQPYAKNSPTVARLVIMIKASGAAHGARKHQPTKRQVVDYVTAHPEITEACSRINMARARPVGGHAILAAAYCLISEVGEQDTVDDFFNRLLTGENLPARHPILVCRNRLIEMVANRERPTKRIECIFRGWNNFRSDRRIRSIAISGGILPKLAA